MSRQALSAALLLAFAPLAFAAPAGAQGPQRQTASVLFSQKQPGKSTGLRILIDYRNPTDPAGKPFAVQRIVTTLAPGSRIDTGVPEQCKLSDSELMANGARDCPGGSLVGSGKVALSSTGADPTTTADVTLVNNAGELIFVVETPTTPTTRMIIRSPIRGTTITNEVPRLPGGPPDGATAIRTADLTIGAVLRREGSQLRSYITTPPVCPTGNRFANSAAFTYFDGVSQTVAAPTACIDTAAPKVSVRGFPKRCLRGPLRTRVRIEDTSALRGVLVRLNGRRVKSTRSKSFAVRVRRSKLRKGKNRLTVVAVDARGNRFTLGRRFLRCR